MLSLQRPEEGRGIVTDEASGILDTCRGGFIDTALVRDNADRTLYLAAQIARLPATGGTIPLVNEGAERRVVVQPFDAKLVRACGIREVVTRLAAWVDFQASIWHEIATWYRWSSTAFSEQPSAFSPEDLYSNLLGLKIADEVVRQHAAVSEEEYNRNVAAILEDALMKLGPLPREASRLAFEYVDGIWWDSTKRVPDNQLVRHRNFDIGPRLYPWKVADAQRSDALMAVSKEDAQTCESDWTPLFSCPSVTARGRSWPCSRWAERCARCCVAAQWTPNASMPASAPNFWPTSATATLCRSPTPRAAWPSSKWWAARSTSPCSWRAS